MVELVSTEAEKAGTPLSDPEKEILLNASYEPTLTQSPIPEDLRKKAKSVIKRIFEAETQWESDENPKSFSNSMVYAGDTAYPNVVALAEEVVREFAETRRLHGWALVRNRLQLVGCGILVVLLMFVVVFLAGVVFHWK